MEKDIEMTIQKPACTPLKQILFENGTIQAGTSLKDLLAPEKGNQALHVCQNPEDVLKNRRRLAEQSLPLEDWILPWQKHTDHIERVDARDRGKGALEAQSSILECDGLYTTDPGCLIGVFTADCCGIVLTDSSVPMVMVIHSGWKGTTKAILDKALDTLEKEGLFHKESLQAYFSPSLLYDSFEVGEEVVDLLQKMAKERNLIIDSCIRKGNKEGKYYIDNQGINVLMLQKHGIDRKNIHISGMDTAKLEEECFSFRRDKPLGEHFTYAWIKEPRP